MVSSVWDVLSLKLSTEYPGEKLGRHVLIFV